MRSKCFPRAARRAVGVCLSIALALVLACALALSARAGADVAPKRARAGALVHAISTAKPRGKLPVEPIVIDGVLAYPPRAGDLTVVYLHGIHGRAENGCPYLRAGASEIGWLVCPEANMPDAPGFTWAGSAMDKRAIVERAERAAHARGADPSAPGVVVGFSQGSYVALELVRAGLGRYRGLVLLAADVAPTAAELRGAGVSRVALGAGDRDAASLPLRRTVERLAAEGFEARFVSLGAVGHTYTAEDPSALADAIAWAGGA